MNEVNNPLSYWSVIAPGAVSAPDWPSVKLGEPPISVSGWIYNPQLVSTGCYRCGGDHVPIMTSRCPGEGIPDYVPEAPCQAPSTN